MGQCSELNCARKATRRGLCGRHYSARKRAGEFGELCRVPNCTKGGIRNGLCSKHSYRDKRYGDVEHTHVLVNSGVCSVSVCINAAWRGGLCVSHYLRKRRYGREHRIIARRGEGTISKISGYRAIDNKYEHRIVAEKILGGLLPEGARIHHINENRADNRPQNLVVCPSQGYHLLIHRLMREKNINFRDHDAITL